MLKLKKRLLRKKKWSTLLNTIVARFKEWGQRRGHWIWEIGFFPPGDLWEGQIRRRRGINRTEVEGKVRQFSRWAEKKTNGGEENAGCRRVFQRGKIINTSVGHVFGTYTEREKNGDAKDEAVQTNKIPEGAEGNGPRNIDRIINLAIQKKYSFHCDREGKV